MHEYYRNNILKLKKENEAYLRFVKAELEQNTGKPYRETREEIWDFYEKNLLEHFPYIGGDKVGGTKNLTGAYIFVAMGEVLNEYSGRFYTPVPEVGNRRSGAKETTTPF